MIAQGNVTNDHGAHAADAQTGAVLEDDHGAMGSTIISINEAIRRLRSILKDRYPAVRFRVRVARGMERSLDIEWTSGPLADEVVTIARDYLDVNYRRVLLGDGSEAEVSRYDVSRIEVCRLKPDGSVDATRLLYTNGIE